MSPRRLWDDALPVQDKTPFDFFMLLFPTQEVGRILEASAIAWPDGCRPMDRHEFFKVIGLLLAMAVNPLPNRREHWEVITSDGLYPGPNFGGRFNMSRRRFKDCQRYLRLDLDTPSQSDSEYLWAPIRLFLEAFNASMQAKVISGHKAVCGRVGVQLAWARRQTRRRHASCHKDSTKTAGRCLVDEECCRWRKRHHAPP